jgi:2-keto-4-pentenoate hydratase/2-oxohepta-3-ene-1,7-dioic acid hydratase in catechol pathway
MRGTAVAPDGKFQLAEFAMKIVVVGAEERVGALVGDEVLDLNRANAQIPVSLLEFIEAGQQSLDAAQRAIDTIGAAPDGAVQPLAQVRLRAPWPHRRVAMVGGNVGLHIFNAMKDAPHAPGTVEEAIDQAKRDGPWGFWKTQNSVTGPDDDLMYPKRSRHLDYEVELAVVFGKRGKDIKADRVDDYIWGFTLGNDWSDRDDATPARPLSYNLHKNFDGSLSLGPCIVVGEGLDPGNIDLVTKVNAEVRQNYNSRDYIFGVAEEVAYITRDLSLWPGDILCGGTGEGTAIDLAGMAHRNEPEVDRWFLHVGDLVEISSPQIGSLTNRVVAPD